MIIVLQARLRSTRLPAKGFLPFFGQTVWERMCDIALAVRGAEEVVFATGDAPGNELGRRLVEAKGVRFFSGSEDDVLARFYHATAGSRADHVVRLTCDNYLAQPEVIEGLVAAVRADKADYGYVAPLSHFAGEVVSRELLHGHFLSRRYSPKAAEHVTWDIRNDDRTRKLALRDDYLGIDHRSGLTLDNIEDFITMKRLEAAFPSLAETRCLGSLAEALRFQAHARPLIP